MLRRLVFWGSIPFLIPQALYVRRTAPRFAGASGPDEGSTGEGSPMRLHAVGDSIIAGVGASDYSRALIGRTAEVLSRRLERTVDWSTRGRIGARSADLLAELIGRMEPGPADVVLVSVGVNDVTGLRRTTTWVRNLTSIIERLREHSPDAVIAFAGLPPLSGFPLLPQPLRSVIGLRGRVFDQAARDVVARHERVVHVPVDFETSADKFADDGFHPSEESYVDFGVAVADAVIAEISGV